MANILSISVGSSYIKVCELTNKKGVTVNKVVRFKTPEGSFDDGLITDTHAVAKALEENLALNGMTAKQVVFSVFSSRIATKEIRTPVLKEKKLAELIEANATEYFPIDIENYIITHKVIEEDTAGEDKQLRVLLMAAPKEIIKSYYRIARHNGYLIHNIDYAGNSSMQLLRKQVDKGINVVIQIMEDSTIVNIIKNRVLQLQRIIPYGKNVVVDAIAEEREITEEQAVALLSTVKMIHDSFDGDALTENLRYMVNNIARVIEYYVSRSAENQVEKAFLVGDSIELLGLDELFANEFTFPVQQIDGFRKVTVDPSIDMEPRMISRYVGCIGAVIDPVNFIPKEKVERELSAQGYKAMRLAFLGSVLVGIIMITIPAVQFFALQAEERGIEERIRSLKSIEQVVRDYYVATDIMTDATNWMNMSVGNNDVMVEFIENLELKQPSDIAISSLAISEGQVEITATTSTKPTVAKFITQLETIPNVSNVVVTTMSESKDEYDVVNTTFSLVCTFTNTNDAYDFSGAKKPAVE